MKKIVSLALAILMVACLASVFASADVDPEIGVNRAVSIYETETAARNAAEALKARWPQVYVAQPDRGGARVIRPQWML